MSEMLLCIHQHTHLAICSFSQHSEQLKAVGSNSLTVSVDTFTGQFHFFRLNAGTSRTQSATASAQINFALLYLQFCLTIMVNLNYFSGSVSVNSQTSSCKREQARAIKQTFKRVTKNKYTQSNVQVHRSILKGLSTMIS